MGTQPEPSARITAITKLAFCDELIKISEASTGKERRRKVGKWLKGTAAVAAGTGVGTGVYMVGHEGARRALPQQWKKLSPNMRRTILGAGAGAAALGSAALAHKLMESKREYEK